MTCRFMAAASLTCGLISCGTQPTNQAVPPAQLEPTAIEKGIYSGTVTCEYERWVSTFGIVETSTFDTVHTLSFDENGWPTAGADYDPSDDHFDIGGVRLDVTNRAENASSDGYVETAVLSGRFGDGNVSGSITWTMLDDGPGQIDFRFEYAVTYRQNDYPNTERQSCHGVLTRPD